MPMIPPLLLVLALATPVLPGPPASVRGSDEPPSRALSRELCAANRLAGTSGSLRAARWLSGHLERAGWEVEIDFRVVLLSLPRRIELRATATGAQAPLFHRLDTFDPDAVPAGDVPLFNAWSASGDVEAEVVDVGRGLRADYGRLAAEGIAVGGKIAVARYGGAYRGVKAELAEEHGCVGLLLFTDPAEDGPERGEVWPRGPWKPGWAAQRGSIYPLSRAPGDATTPGWPSPAPGAPGERLSPAETDAPLPHIPCVPIGSTHAALLLASPTPPRVRMRVDMRRELRTIHNVVARLAGREPGLVLAGNHRDAWVRGAQDAGSGTISLLRAAQHLGARARQGWQPRHTIVLGFWDAEESGLIGSTEWAEAHAEELAEHAIVYVNGDAVVSGLRFHASGTPGLEGFLSTVLDRIPAPGAEAGKSVGEEWRASFGEDAPSLGRPGSGSDYTVFLHHLGLPILDLGFGGNGGGQYHTVFDDFPMMDRFLDPTWEGHETAGLLFAELLAAFAEEGRAAFDDAAAARAMARMVNELASAEEEAEEKDGTEWLGEHRAFRLELAFVRLAEQVDLVRDRAAEGDLGRYPPFYRSLLAPDGLVGRPWFRNRLWAPGLETGYASEDLPSLRAAAAAGPEELERAFEELAGSVDALVARWHDLWMAAPNAKQEDQGGE